MGNVGPTELLFYIVIFLFSDGMTFGLYRIQTAEQIKEEKVKQNAQLNLSWQKMSGIGLAVTYMIV